MLRMKDLPPMEREGNGSLYRMDAKQRREAVPADQSSLWFLR